jgi:hypothetical protein
MAIRSYRQRKSSVNRRKRPSEIRAELKRIQNEIEALTNHLIHVMAHADALFAFMSNHRPPTGWPPNTGPVSEHVALQRLASALHELRRLATWLGLARSRVPDRGRGAVQQATRAYFLVNHLNEILERFAGKTITRSSKRLETVEYVKIVCRIADPKLGDGSIAEAMKKEIKYYKPYVEISPPSDGTIPPPIQRDNRLKARKGPKRNLGEV